MIFRSATIDDAQLIFQIIQDAFNFNSNTIEQIEDQLNNDNYRFFLVDDHGFISLTQFEDEADINQIAVKKEFQNQKIASFLIEELMKTLNGVFKIHLEVRASNEIAKHLYIKFGFKQISVRKNYYSNPIEDANVMLYEKENNLIVAFESSADETSVAVVKNGNEVLSNIVATQINSHQRFGGIVPEVASRHHLEWINKVLELALKKANIDDPKKQITAVGATYGPGLVGSLLVGLMAGKTFAMVNDLPFIGVNHLAGHILAANFNKKIIYPALALMVSGGHTELVLMPSENKFEVIGETLDDAAGEAFDKIGRVMGLKYPAGKEIQELAKQGNNNISFPIAHTQGEFDFSFSGLKSAVINYLHKAEQKNESINKNDLLSSFQQAVIDALIEKTDLALSKFKVKMLLVGGGVAANELLRNSILNIANKYDVELNLVPMQFAGDNAAMIGAAAYVNFKHNEFSNLKLDTNPSLDFPYQSHNL
ncbi:MAG: tRNA (adenosine(37)-N6)-threonylcarbamoyltransferase complex transferase subunit TsaD [Lactobacillaceae bacterium]|jgi:N6-L-threonylcarbamoyladenine synthase|nr:tRNA (adenosine(37)-N6)-threonylcarbamoyltransferase complex transferase subunit TsaD [Lactobacillaceae bacterium]